jgi:hypothetical protein
LGFGRDMRQQGSKGTSRWQGAKLRHSRSQSGAVTSCPKQRHNHAGVCLNTYKKEAWAHFSRSHMSILAFWKITQGLHGEKTGSGETGESSWTSNVLARRSSSLIQQQTLLSIWGMGTEDTQSLRSALQNTAGCREVSMFSRTKAKGRGLFHSQPLRIKQFLQRHLC